MARTLKTFVTSVGFFDLAVAAPSMKAALDAWGFRHNAFQQGFASQTRDAGIIKAATARPGVVLRRPVGTDHSFQEEAELPKGFTLPGTAPAPRPASGKVVHPVKTGARSPKDEDKVAKAAIISFKAEKARRDRKRAREEAAAKRALEKRNLAVSKAQVLLEKARRQHEDSLEGLERARGQLDDRIRRENEMWQRLRGKLEAAVDRERNR